MPPARKAAAAAAAASTSLSPPDEDDLPMLFPMHVMKMSDFLGLKRLWPHNELKASGLVRSLRRQDLQSSKCYINFVSHQWLGNKEADPNGDHLRTMQEVFRAASGEEPTSIFKTPEDWTSYSTGATSANAKLVASSVGEQGAAAVGGGAAKTPEALRASIMDGFVWMDYISIPQTIGCQTDDELDKAISDQGFAIRSIPAYASAATNFWVCCPSGARHADKWGSAAACGYDTWADRGWCRIEEAAHLLTRHGDSRPLIVSNALGETPQVTVQTGIDRSQAYMQRESAVLTGAFTFPDAHLVRAKKSDNEKEVPGDKEQLKPVLTELYARMLKSLRAKFEKDPAHTGLLMPCITRSFKGDQSFFRYMTYRSTETRLLAESTDEPDWVAQGWSKPFEELEESDVEAWCQDMYGLHFLVDGKPQEDLAWFVAGTGNLPLFRYLIETAGLNIEYVGGSGGSALLNASRGGCHSIVAYICERCSATHVNHAMAEDKGVHFGSLGALGVACFAGHAQSVAILLEHGAKFDEKLPESGRSVLHVAAEEGRLDCVRLLLQAGADVTSQDANGKTALDLVEAKGFTTRRFDMTLRVLRGWGCLHPSVKQFVSVLWAFGNKKGCAEVMAMIRGEQGTSSQGTNWCMPCLPTSKAFEELEENKKELAADDAAAVIQAMARNTAVTDKDANTEREWSAAAAEDGVAALIQSMARGTASVTAEPAKEEASPKKEEAEVAKTEEAKEAPKTEEAEAPKTEAEAPKTEEVKEEPKGFFESLRDSLKEQVKGEEKKEEEKAEEAKGSTEVKEEKATGDGSARDEEKKEEEPKAQTVEEIEAKLEANSKHERKWSWEKPFGGE